MNDEETQRRDWERKVNKDLILIKAQEEIYDLRNEVESLTIERDDWKAIAELNARAANDSNRRIAELRKEQDTTRGELIEAILWELKRLVNEAIEERKKELVELGVQDERTK